MSGTLFRYGAHAIVLADAVKAFAEATIESHSVAVGLVYTPRACVFARVDKRGVFEWPPAPTVMADEIFEARVLNEHAELRWLRKPVSEIGEGAAAIIGPNELAGFGFPFRSMSPLVIVDEIKGQYLLWGLGASSDDGVTSGWSRLTTARIGTLWVPIDGVGTGASVVLTYVEHLGEGEHGNVFVAEERLTGLRSVSATKTREGAP